MDRSSLPLNQVAQFYYTACRTEGKTAKTMRGYEEKLSRFVRWFNSSVGELTLERAREFVAALQATEKWCDQPSKRKAGVKVSPQTVANHVRVMKAFASWLYEEGYKQENVLARLVLPRVPSKVIEVLTDEEIGRLLAAVKPKDDMALRDLGILVLFLDTGLRLSELLALQLDDLHFAEQWLKVMGKGQKERVVPYGARTSQILTRYIQQGRYDPLGRPELFLGIDGEPASANTIKMLFTRLKNRSGIQRLHPHLLRHTFATSYLVAGGDVFTLQNILGHTTLEMTRRYVALASSQVNLQHRRFSPMDRLDTPALRSRRPRAQTAEPVRPQRSLPVMPRRTRIPAALARGRR
jgi:integrase/recombinase XerC/integrase/recombinase XerD